MLYDDLRRPMASRRRHVIPGLATLLGVLGPWLSVGTSLKRSCPATERRAHSGA